ncbi:ribosomal L7Ae/L30e/S12e/Gadd45 family protein [Metallumcola ferriviriculae]|uniref:Ribosomal L7Ae/L30e/S12e/Gadd45 family protein n=1 Tax=Metallumcola ferriviriculae TaxID=3039180 RepID=A0AAU0UQY9_9FIRM|nr:ribosomal L7Ae/L30e/S12e/Gadd45 family protein [Desulfitibacteraceae bacterium MK1]
MSNQVFALIGFAQKAGKVISGDQVLQDKLKNGRVKLIIIAIDTAENTKDKLLNNAERLGVPWCVTGTKVQLGLSIGKSPRSALGILDPGLARKVYQLMN